MKESVVDMFVESMSQVETEDGGEQPTPEEEVETKDDDKSEEPEKEAQEPAKEKPIDTVEIDGLKVNYYEAEDGKLEWEAPEGYSELTEAEQAAFDRKVDEGSHTLSSLKRDRMNQNKEKERLAALEEENVQLKKRLAESAAQEEKPETGDEPMKYWGVASWEDVTDLQTLDPKKYQDGLAERAADLYAVKSKANASNAAIQQKITEAGKTFNEVEAFAEARGIKNIGTALEHMLLLEGKETDKVLRRRSKAPENKVPGKGGEIKAPQRKREEYEILGDYIAGSPR